MLIKPRGEKLFLFFNSVFLLLVALLCLFPMLNVLAISFSSKGPAGAGEVGLWPVGFTTASYEFVFKMKELISSFVITFERVFLGTVVNMLLTVLIAYPLSKEVNIFPRRTFYVWFFVVTILFSGGIVPLYLTVLKTGLIDTIWALILPSAVPVFNVILLLNFFRDLPKEVEESAFIDGANVWNVLWKIYLPLSKPALATIGLFTIVGHWNSWFDGLIFMNNPRMYPLQTFLQISVLQQNFNEAVSFNINDIIRMAEISDKTVKSALIFIGALPILILYPFLQKYFTKGIVLGSVKG